MNSITIFTILITICSAILYLLYVLFPKRAFQFALNIERFVAGLEKDRMEINNHVIVYTKRKNPETETILLLHYFGGDKDNWTRFAKYIPNRYHLIIPDLPGFGESTRLSPENYSIPDQVEHINQFIRKLNIRSLHIVGNSMGGYIAGKYAAKYPEKVKTLALFNNSGVSPNVPSEHQTNLANGKDVLTIQNADQFEHLLDFVFCKKPWLPGRIKTYMVEQAIENYDFNFAVHKVIIRNYFSLESELHKINAKTFILWGDKDRVNDISTVTTLQRKIPITEIAIMKNCGHMPMLERPKEAADHYVKFLRNSASVK